MGDLSRGLESVQLSMEMKTLFPLGGADEAHVVPLPALQEAALVVIGARAFGLKRLAALEIVDIEIPHIGADALEVLDEFVIGGHSGAFLPGEKKLIFAYIHAFIISF
jgi:hypothetical protein